MKKKKTTREETYSDGQHYKLSTIYNSIMAIFLEKKIKKRKMD